MSLSVGEVRAFQDRVSSDLGAIDPDEALTLIRVLEEVKNAATAAQAALTVVVHDAQTAADKARGIGANETARVVGVQVGLARRCSPRLGRRFLGVARAMTEMPHTASALRSGVIGEWQATQVVAETAFLSLADRQLVDSAVKDILGKVPDSRLAGAARAAAYRADPEAAVARRSKAEKDRRVSLRPAPDCMTLLTALLPVADGVACYAALGGEGASGPDDDRGKGQLMADALVERLTGRPARYAPAQPPAAEGQPVSQGQTGSVTADTRPVSSPVAVHLLVPMEALSGNAEGHLDGFGPIPSDVVRQFLADHEQAGGLIRRVFTAPGSGQLVAMDSRARAFPGLLAAFVRLRDQVCRTPFCGGKIQHTDHITPYAEGGATSVDNADGKCAQCNYAKQNPDVTERGDADQYTITVRGLEETSRPPSPPGRTPSACAMRDRIQRFTIRLRVDWGVDVS
ncbi:HNH endonuclease [Branchiibius cervicis]|uniref:HNH endonuclease n=1 Tax=Branchiibius cervicis TaxID=908252 RepID=A0ABW2ARA1_9MICO